MFTIKNNVKNEIIINKSKFITYLYKIENEDGAKDIINYLKKEYKDATHHCYAYVTDNIKRFSDDKEPSGTAGMPILNVIESNNLNNVLVVVIRYFGGIKLGAGGLLRAYTNSVSNALKLTDIIPFIKETKFMITFNYDNLTNVDYILKDYQITYKEYDENITYEFVCEKGTYPDKLDKFIIKKKEC